MVPEQCREQIEAVLLERLRQAQQRWRAGKAYTLHARIAAGESGADSRYAAARAITEYSLALAAYSRALNEWADFTVDGKVPDWMLDHPGRKEPAE